jgi:hypothetical protein
MNKPLRIEPPELDYAPPSSQPARKNMSWKEELLAEVQQMHACLDAMDDDRHLGWMWTATWTLVGFTLGLIAAVIWL